MNKLSDGIAHKLPRDLANALSQKDDISELWEILSPIARNEFICWIEDAKRNETREKRIRRTIEDLREGKKRPCCWAGCIHRTDKQPGKWQQAVLLERKSKK